MTVTIRPECAGEEDAIHELVERAFAGAPHSDGSEAAIVSRLRTANALTISLVAEEQEDLVGHLALSPVTIDGRSGLWFGLGPVAVEPQWQHKGIGGNLVRAGLDLLRANAAGGCVVLGEPAYYGRFGFVAERQLTYPGAPPEYFQAIRFMDDLPSGRVDYHPAFTG